MRSVLFFLLFIALNAATVRAAAVIEIFVNDITVYSDHSGAEPTQKLRREDIQLPAAQLSNPSDFGLIMVRFELKDANKDAVTGWVRKGAVKLDRKLTVNIGEPCGKSLSTSASVTRGTRALGDRC